MRRREQITLKIIKKYLAHHNIALSKSEIKDKFYSYLANDGSIRFLKDFLNDLEIVSKVYKVKYLDLINLECPMIAHINNGYEYFIVVTEIKEGVITYYDPFNGNVQENINLFLKKWDGVILISFINDSMKRKTRYQSIIRFNSFKIFPIVGFLLGFFIILSQLFLFHKTFILNWSILFVLKTIGLIIMISIVKIEIGLSDSIINSLCDLYDCKKIIKSNSSTILPFCTMGDLGLTYFSSGIMILLISVFFIDVNPILNTLKYFNYLTLPMIIYSIYLQAFTIKKFCPFCFGTIVILWAEFFWGFMINSEFVSLNTYSFSSIILALNLWMWFFIKPFLIKSINYKNLKLFTDGIKKDLKLFSAFLSIQDKIPLNIKTEITIGNSDSKTILIILLSPNCPSCVKIFKMAMNYARSEQLTYKIIFRFIGKKNENIGSNQVIDFMHAFMLDNKQEKLFEIYKEWYILKDKNIVKWKSKCNLENTLISPEAKKIRLTYLKWIDKIDINGLPAFILNDKIIPKYYTFPEINYLINKI